MNVRGLQGDASTRLRKLKNLISAARKYGDRRNKIDAIIIQELNMPPNSQDTHKRTALSLGAQWVASYGKESNGVWWGGVAIIILRTDWIVKHTESLKPTHRE